MAVFRPAMLFMAGAMLFAQSSASLAEDLSGKLKAQQQYVMMALAVYDHRARTDSPHFQSPGPFVTKDEVEELRHKNQSVLLAKSTGSTGVLKDVPYYGRLPIEIRAMIMERHAGNDWDEICAQSAQFGVESFQIPIDDYSRNREVYLLSVARIYALDPDRTAQSLNALYLDAETAIDIRDGKREPLTCEEIWALRNGGNLIQSSSRKAAQSDCKRFHQLTQCLVDLERRIGELLPAEHRNGSKIHETWQELYLNDTGAFVALLSE